MSISGDVVIDFSREEIVEGLVGAIFEGALQHGKFGIMASSSWVANGDEVNWIVLLCHGGRIKVNSIMTGNVLCHDGLGGLGDFCW